MKAQIAKSELLLQQTEKKLQASDAEVWRLREIVAQKDALIDELTKQLQMKPNLASAEVGNA